MLLTNTPLIHSTITSLPSTSPLLEFLPKSASEPIPHTALIAFARHLRQSHTKTPATTISTASPPASSNPPTLNALLRHTCPYFPSPRPTPAPSAEYLALKARLLRAEEQRKYNALLHPKSAETLQEAEDDDASEDNIPPSLVLNIFLSIILCGFVAWHVTRHWQNDGVRVLTALGVSVVVGTAEVVVYAAYLRKVAEARRKERGRQEQKSVLGPVPVLTDDAQGEGKSKEVERDRGEIRDVGDKEEIWGRGVNGGVRRRVREKWEKKQQKQGDL